MVEVFLVHPDLNITDCSDCSSTNLRQHQTKYIRAVNEYENLIHNIVANKEKSTNIDASSIQSLTENLSKSSVNEFVNDDSISSFYGDKEVMTRIPLLPDYDVEIERMSGLLSSMEKTLLEYYKTRLQLELLYLNYAMAFSLMNKTMREVFSKLELSLKEEEEGIKLIAKDTESIKGIEQKLSKIKMHKVELEDDLVNHYGLLSYQDHSTLNSTKRKSSGFLNSINEEEAIV